VVRQHLKPTEAYPCAELQVNRLQTTAIYPLTARQHQGCLLQHSLACTIGVHSPLLRHEGAVSTHTLCMNSHGWDPLIEVLPRMSGQDAHPNRHVSSLKPVMPINTTPENPLPLPSSPARKPFDNRENNLSKTGPSTDTTIRRSMDGVTQLIHHQNTVVAHQDQGSLEHMYEQAPHLKGSNVDDIHLSNKAIDRELENDNFSFKTGDKESGPLYDSYLATPGMKLQDTTHKSIHVDKLESVSASYEASEASFLSGSTYQVTDDQDEHSENQWKTLRDLKQGDFPSARYRDGYHPFAPLYNLRASSSFTSKRTFAASLESELHATDYQSTHDDTLNSKSASHQAGEAKSTAGNRTETRREKKRREWHEAKIIQSRERRRRYETISSAEQIKLQCPQNADPQIKQAPAFQWAAGEEDKLRVGSESATEPYHTSGKPDPSYGRTESQWTVIEELKLCASCLNRTTPPHNPEHPHAPCTGQPFANFSNAKISAIRKVLDQSKAEIRHNDILDSKRLGIRSSQRSRQWRSENNSSMRNQHNIYYDHGSGYLNTVPNYRLHEFSGYPEAPSFVSGKKPQISHERPLFEEDTEDQPELQTMLEDSDSLTPDDSLFLSEAPDQAEKIHDISGT
jgi:hypothetical protein